jgi:cobalt/nickel transport system permease protein
MAKISSSFLDIGYLDTLACRATSIHRLDPRAKLVTTLVFIVSIVSFNKYQVASLIPFAVYPVVLTAMADLPAAYLCRKILMAAPFAFFIGILNPFWDRHILVQLGTIGISGGWISFASIMLRFLLTVSAALILIASTGFNAVCLALEKMGTPRSFVVQLLFLYRYIFVLTDEASRMVRARSLRAFGGNGMGIRVFGSMIGHLLLRTLDRAQRIHLAMLCRGFDGEIRIARALDFSGRDALFCLGWCGVFIIMRLYNIPELIGNAAIGFMR